MSTNIIKEREGTVALLTGGSRRIGAAIVEGLAADGADAASAFVTNGVQQVLRLSTPIAKAVSER
jgi:NAD(P)-dependent dehydrogenase (short-subunit alcohol dehydrogenase family)